MKHPFTLLLLSGGLDSVTLLYDLQSKGCRTFCVMFDYRQRHLQELLWAKKHCLKTNSLFTTVQLPELGGLTEQSWIVPVRNKIFISVAANVALTQWPDFSITQLAIAANKDDADYFPDCRKEFFDSENQSLKAAGYSIEIVAPYLEYSKRMIVDRARQLGINLNDTWSCYQPTSNGPCNECLACKKRMEACGQ